MKNNLLLLITGLFLFTVALTGSSCKKKTTDEDEYYPTAYIPTFIAQGTKYSNSGYSFLYFELKCTTDAVEINSVSVSGPFGTGTYSGGGEIFSQNQPIYIYDENRFLYADGKYTFTITGYVRSGAHSGVSFTRVTSWELIIP